MFELLSKKHSLMVKVQSRTELYFKIINDPPMSIRQFIPTIPNEIDNLISMLLEKRKLQAPQ